MGHENTDRVRAYIAAYNRFDIDEMIAQLHPDVTFRNYANGALTHETKGVTAFRAQAEAAAKLFSARHQSIRALNAGAECITVDIDYKGVFAIDLPEGPRAGDFIELVGRSEFLFKGGKIILIVDRS